MKLFKMADRGLKASDILKTYRTIGSTKQIGEFCRWKELRNGGQLQVSLTVYEIKNDMFCAYLVEDGLGNVATELQPNKNEVLTFLKEHGFKPVKQWYIEDYGMTEEAWNEWNGITEE